MEGEAVAVEGEVVEAEDSVRRLWRRRRRKLSTFFKLLSSKLVCLYV